MPLVLKEKNWALIKLKILKNLRGDYKPGKHEDSDEMGNSVRKATSWFEKAFFFKKINYQQ